LIKCSNCGKETKKIYYHVLCFDCYTKQNKKNDTRIVDVKIIDEEE